jgi:glutamate carboxypeptidase
MEARTREILDAVRAREPEMLALLKLFVNMDSGSYDKEGIDAFGDIMTDELKSLGFETSILSEAGCGNHVLAERAEAGEGRLFLSAHLDPVHPRGTAAATPFRIEGGYAYGPGVGDIKGGIVQMLHALKALRDLKRETPPISVFLTGDEEIGSVHGRPYIEEIARCSTWVLFLEPSSKPGSVAVRRWGLGSFYLTIHGKPAHVLKPGSDGGNACRELALKILALECLSDPVAGIRVSVNLVRGGRSLQVTAAEARADVDVRVRDPARMESVVAGRRPLKQSDLRIKAVKGLEFRVSSLGLKTGLCEPFHRSG